MLANSFNFNAWFIRTIIYLIGFVSERLKLKGKRILFVSSLCYTVTRSEDDRVNLIDTVEEFENIVTNRTALDVGELIYQDIWSVDEMRRVIDNVSDKQNIAFHLDDDGKRIGEMILAKTPAWLKYDTKLMINDLTNVIVNKYCMCHTA